MRTKLYLASTEALRDEKRFVRLLETVPETRREKVLAFRPDSARRLSLGAGLLLNFALAAEGVEAKEICVTEYGKPYLPALPDFHFSLSHSGERVLCAVSNKPVGCDIEAPGRYDPKIAKRFFHPSESAWLFSLPEDEQPAAFLRLWTCKESYVKALGLGLNQPLDSFAVQLEPVGFVQMADERPWRLRSFRDGDCACALCGLVGVEDAPVQRVDFSEVSV
jgi:4'-phosphopantetheinyl transferase